MISSRYAVGLLLLMVALSLPAATQENRRDLTALSLEDLMNIEVTSVSKKDQKLSQTPAAIFVITEDAIRRSGARSIPDLLRMVPGVQVAQMNANTWAISARGLNGRLSNELLVLLDGRAVYTPTFAGVYWEVLDMPLEDIDRVEVIRGPGGSIWGTNAVNGVINIITKRAAESRGGMIVASAGTNDDAYATTQYGGRLGASVDYRVYTRYLNQAQFRGLANRDGADNWHVMRGGFRVDSAVSPRDELMLEGDMYTGRAGTPTATLTSILSPVQDVNTWANLSGGFLQAVWKRRYSERSETSLQMSFDRYSRSDIFSENRNCFDLEFQHRFMWKARHEFIWGADYIYSNSNSQGSLAVSMNPSTIDTHTAGVFLQDEIALLRRTLFLTLGSKLEVNHYTGLNVMPSARLAWVPNKTHTVWTAVSHAVRTPASQDVYMRFNFGGLPAPGPMPMLLALIGNPKPDDEGVDAFEAGVRTTAAENFSFDVAAFYNRYTSRRTTDPAPPFVEASPPPVHLVVPVTANNFMYGEGHGLEVAANWNVTPTWLLSPGYAFENIHMHLRPPSVDWTSVLLAQGSAPRHSAQLRSRLNITPTLVWNAAAYFVDRLPSGPVPGYTRIDTGVTWRPAENIAFTVFGQNLADTRHLEFLDNTGVKSTRVGRGAYAQVTWNF